MVYLTLSGYVFSRGNFLSLLQLNNLASQPLVINSGMKISLTYPDSTQVISGERLTFKAR